MLQDHDSRYEQHDISLADFDQLISMQYQLVAAVAKIPAEKLFKTPISGLGQTGAYAEHDYKQELQSLQERVYMPVVNRANEIIMRSDLERTEAIAARFNPVDMPTEREKAEIQEIKARINVNYLNSGVITPEEARDALRNDKDSGYAGLTDEVPEDYGGENLPDNGNENGGQPPNGNIGGKAEGHPSGKDQQDIFYHGQFHKYKISEEELKKYNRPVPAHNGNTDNNTAEDRKPFNESEVKRDRKGQFAEQNEKGAEKSEEPQEQEQQENLSGGFYGKKPKDKRGSKHSKGTAGKKHYYGISDMTAAEAEAKLKSYAPETVAGAKRGKPMSFEEADHGRGNPNYKLGGGHTSNCQASVLAHILRLRGYDVSALPFSKKNPAFKELASDPRKGFVIDDKGTHPDYIKHKKLKNMPEVISFLNDTIPIGTIYCFEKHDTYFGDGHICLIDKSNNGNLRIHDPQTGVTVFEEGFKKYFGKIIFEGINIFRADNAGVNSEIADKVLRSNKK